MSHDHDHDHDHDHADHDRDVSGEHAHYPDEALPEGSFVDGGALTRDVDEGFDYVVVGSGAAGAVAAHTLAKAGFSVAIVEEGPWVKTREFGERVYEAFRRMYRDSGTQVLEGRSYIPLIQGRCVGGSTVMNSAIAHRTPEDVLAEWDAREATTSLAEYVSRMKPDQPAIYYVLGETQKAASSSPHLEALAQRGYEVLVMTDPVDEWATESLREFDKKPLVSAMRADFKLDETDEQKKARDEQSKALAPLLSRVKTALGDRVTDVRLSDRLTDSPCCLVRGEHGAHAFVERMLKQRGHALPRAQHILELNGGHPLVKRLEQLVETDPSSPRIDALIDVLHGQALLTEGSALDDPNLFAKNLTQLLTDAG
jgi:HSP90 family molecular chaperone